MARDLDIVFRRDLRMSTNRIRWWPAIFITGLAALAFAWIWLREAPMAQSKVVSSYPVLGGSVIALALWLILASRLSAGVRVVIALSLISLAVLGGALFEIQGVDGNLLPVIGFRWQEDPRLGTLDIADTPSRSPSAARNAPSELVGAGAALPTGPMGTDFPQFYGPRRNSTLAGPRLATDWSTTPPRELWRIPVGEAWSSFAVVGDAAITLEQRGDEEVIVRYELSTGRPVWTFAQQAAFITTIGGRGPRSTPSVLGEHVYALGATGILTCVRFSDGSLIWTRNVLEDHGAVNSEWGMASSPLLVGELVVIQLGVGGTSLAAYHRNDGRPAWQQGEDFGSYSSPILSTIAGREQILVANFASVAGHDAISGERLWSSDWKTPGQRITPPLVIGDDLVLVSAGYGVGSRLLRLTASGDEFIVEEVWESRRLKSKFASMVVLNDTVYGLDDGVLVALDPQTGERRWKQGRYGHGQILLVGELLLILSEKGDLVLVAADPLQHRELAQIEVLDGKSWNPPALAGNLLLVRNNREAACYELALET